VSWDDNTSADVLSGQLLSGEEEAELAQRKGKGKDGNCAVMWYARSWNIVASMYPSNDR
jgi:hypothetical protein